MLVGRRRGTRLTIGLRDPEALPVLPTWAERGTRGGYELSTTPPTARRAPRASAGPDAARRPVRRPLDDPLPRSLAPGVVVLGGSIDPSLDQRRAGDALVWKCGGPDPIWSPRLGSDDASPIGTPNLRLAPSAPFEDGVVDGPALVRIGGALTPSLSAGQWRRRRHRDGRERLGPRTGVAGAAVPEVTDAANPVGPAGRHPSPTTAA